MAQPPRKNWPIRLWRVSRDCPNFLRTPYYLRNEKSYGFQIWPVHSESPSEQKPINFFEKRERGRIQGLPNFSGYLLLSQEREKLRISNLAIAFGTKSPLKFLEKRGPGRIQKLPNFFGCPLLSQEREKLPISNLASTNFKFCVYIYRLNRNKKSH